MTSRSHRDAFGRGAGLALVATVLFAPPLAADSIFSAVGFGRWQSPADVRSAGMGDVSVVAPSRWSFSPRNPALISYLDEAAGHISVRSDFTRVNAGSGGRTRPDAQLPLVGVGVPIVADVVAAVHLYDLNDARYDVEQRVAGDPAYTLRTRGSGAWTQAALSVGRRFGAGAAGFQVGLPFTAFDEQVTRDFDETDDFVTREEAVETGFEGAAMLTFGGHYTLGRVSAGGFFQLPTVGEVVTTRAVGPEDETREVFTLRIPAAFGGGMALRARSDLVLTGEWRFHPWEDLEIGGVNWSAVAAERGITRGFMDQSAWGVGAEWGRRLREGARRRLILRAGYSRSPWITAGPARGQVTDKAFTLGLGIPFVQRNGAIDLAVRYTRRRESTSTLREDVVSVLLGLSFTRQPRTY